MMFSIAAAALLASAPSGPQQIDVAKANWAAFPPLVTEALAVPNEEMIRRVQLMLQRGECEFPGQKARRFDVTVNYAVKLDSQGNATNIIVEDVGCRALELYVGRIAADIVEEGFVRVAPPSKPRWYGNRIDFTLQ